MARNVDKHGQMAMRTRALRAPVRAWPVRGIVTALLVALVALVAMAWPATAEAATLRARLADAPPGSLVAVLTDDLEIYLEATPEGGEGLYAFCRRLTGSSDTHRAVAAANDHPRRLLSGVRYRVPFELLTPELQGPVLLALFPDDRGAPDAWHHAVTSPGPARRPSLWQVAGWFTGSGERFRELRQANRLVEDDLARGQVLEIPRRLLRPSLAAALDRLHDERPWTPPDPPPVQVAQPADNADPPAGSSSLSPASPAVAALAAGGGDPARFSLTYGRDGDGEYAAYRLRPGEALYSSVVVRFTGRILAVDVNALAEEIAERSGIDDVTDIPVGYAVKVPFELLLPEYLPAGHPRRLAYEEGLAESRQFTNRVQVADLAGITIILDAGHGGVDPGSSFGGVWESLYVYDIKLRVKELLERHTAARVIATLRDGDEFTIHDRDVLPFSRNHTVLTDPPYPIRDTVPGVHLRWYLANSAYRRALATGADPQRVVFLSIHADSLHPSIRGAMAYIPGASGRAGSFRKDGPVYQARREWREGPSVSYSWADRIESEGLSRQLAEQMIAAFDRRSLAVHPYKPVREKIIKKRGSYVPAVLRYNAVPAKVLLEVCNLANAEDRRLLQTRAWRQEMAEAIVESILAYYGQGEAGELDRGVVAAR